MLFTSEFVETLVGRDAVLEQEPHSEIAGEKQQYTKLLSRPPVIEVHTQAQALTVHVLPPEIRWTTVEQIRCLDISCVAEHKRDAIVAILSAILRVHVDLSPYDAIVEIACDIKRLEAIAEAFFGRRNFSMAATLRRMIGENSISQDTATRALKSVCPHYVDHDHWVSCWRPEASSLLDSGPYVFGSLFQQRIDSDNLDSNRRERYTATAIEHIKCLNIDNLTKLAEYIEPIRKTA